MRLVIGIVAAIAALRSIDACAQQRADVGLLLGSTTATTEAVLQFDRATTYQATFAWRLAHTETLQWSVEVPFIASPAFTVVPPRAGVPLEYASLYLTPGLRATFLPKARLSVFGAIGGGYARYSESRLKSDRSPNPEQLDTNTGALQFGGGIDVRGFGWLGFRGELRDVYTGARRFSIGTPGGRVHNVIGSGGLVVRF
jgi:hypothetical protein